MSDKRIVWNDIYKKLKDDSYMGEVDVDYFRTALILTGNYQDELQVYDGRTRQAKTSLKGGYNSVLQKYVDAVKEVAGDRQTTD